MYWKLVMPFSQPLKAKVNVFEYITIELTGRKYILHLRSINNQQCTLTSSKRSGDLANSRTLPQMFQPTPNLKSMLG